MSINISAEAFSAFASSVGVIVAITALIVESRRARLTQSIEIIDGLDARFETPEFREIRRQAASFLLDPKADNHRGKGAAICVLNFFESL